MWKSVIILAAGAFVELIIAPGYGADDVSAALDSPVGLWKTFDVDGQVESWRSVCDCHKSPRERGQERRCQMHLVRRKTQRCSHRGNDHHGGDEKRRQYMVGRMDL